jgi:hypothetical protein
VIKAKIAHQEGWALTERPLVALEKPRPVIKPLRFDR